MGTVIVDLDNTLIKTDLLIEGAISFFKKNPFRFWQLIIWSLKGPLALKSKLSQEVGVEPSELPYDEKVISLIQDFKMKGQKVVLVSASPQKWVSDVAFHLDIFDDYLGSTDTNLKGLAKHEAIVSRFGVNEFVYVADSVSDLPIWQKCKKAVVVNGSNGIIRKLKSQAIAHEILETKPGRIPTLFRLLRVHQWAKNILLFAPVLAAHKWSFEDKFNLLYGFISFSFAASAVYIFNDLLDIQSDRRHRTKKERPIASGNISILEALMGLAVTLILGLSVGAMVNSNFVEIVIGYLSLNLLYTLYLKRQMALDIIILSGMYTIRLYAGAAITLTPISGWLLAYSTFFFFSLACVKRFTELSSLKSGSDSGRGYIPQDGEIVRTLGVSSGMLSILVLLLYTQSPEVVVLYGPTFTLWFLAPIMLFWIARLWILTCRKMIDDDPVIFAIRDKWSWVCLLGILWTLGVSSI